MGVVLRGVTGEAGVVGSVDDLGVGGNASNALGAAARWHAGQAVHVRVCGRGAAHQLVQLQRARVPVATQPALEPLQQASIKAPSAGHR